VLRIPAAEVRWDLVVLAVLATLATALLLVSTVRAAHRPHERPREQEPRRDRRRRSSKRPDPREALELVGDALAATHNPRALLPVILDVVTEATGARGGRIVRGGEELGWVGNPSANGEELRLDLSGEDEAAVTTLVLYPPSGGFGPETRQLAEWLASQAAIALDNARLHDIVQRQAMTDDLTGLVNRRRFMSALDAEVERASRIGGALSVVLIDLDDFKLINDRFGHHSGDRVLEAFGGLLVRHIRDVDIAARLGGEEFALLLPEADLAGAVTIAGRLRASLSGRPLVRADGHALSLTASFGVAHYEPGDTGEDLLRFADHALYRAKGEGKNRVCVAREGRAA
jgi:diguanylate cyclase (GGDEF)-like protein